MSFFNPKPKPIKVDKKTGATAKPLSKSQKDWKRAKDNSTCDCGHSKSEHSEVVTPNKDNQLHACSKCVCSGFILYKTKPQIRQSSEEYKKPIVVPENMRQTLEHQLDDLVSKYVIKRDAKCIVCGSKNELTAGHYMKRQYMLIRWDIDNHVKNVNCQCVKCNEIHNKFEMPYRYYMVKTYGEEFTRWLETEGKITKKWTEEELLEMVKQIKFMLKELP